MSFLHGKKLAEEFLERNSLPIPSILESGLLCVNRNIGEYRKSVCVVVVDSSQCWGPTGHAVDYSIVGVIMHEIGHHVDYVTGRKAGLLQSINCECYNRKETVAETIRLFILNKSALPEVNLHFCEEILCLKTCLLGNLRTMA